ncbi:hypothetical protein V2A60_005048 [Cordyceps javanica]|uniref:N-acetyltransferase domain-containing protein n=1 Tax=Cordyceps javanica TaxID=43265 RepID=A0A545W9S0_9HYPO|nr:n-acetyltransferase domain-containing protein [Cordyceps javanica]TQW10747.1 n-acetyltransferase domain-containing protein [Cordyceps javanica]
MKDARQPPQHSESMSLYSPAQLERYFSLISLPNWKTLAGHDARDFFDQMIKCQLARITYNTLSLHYAKGRPGSLDADVLFDKIVGKDRGGYCFELNVFFLQVIRSLGFEAMGVGCRMRDQRSTSEGLDRWRATSHMAIVVIINGERFLVDVGCGAQSPVTLLLLRSGQAATGLMGQALRMESKKLATTAMSKPVWIYSMRFGGEGAWKEIYAFADAEYLAADFDVLNYYTLHASPFTRMVVVQSFFFQRTCDGASGTLSLVKDSITQNVDGEDEPVAVLRSERERVEALGKHFGIQLSEDELDAIKGSAYALPVAD